MQLMPITNDALRLSTMQLHRCALWLQSLEKQLQQIDLTLEENGGRIGVMDEHLKNVQQEITYTESRVRRLSTAAHFKSCTFARSWTAMAVAVLCHGDVQAPCLYKSYFTMGCVS
jgi:hypothetical protein